MNPTPPTAGRGASRRTPPHPSLHSLFRHFPGVTALLDVEGRLLSATASAIELFRGDDPTILGQFGASFLHPDDQGEALRLFADVASTPLRSRSAEFRLRHADGGWHWFQAHATNLVEDPEFGGILVRLRDITERRRQEHRLRDLFERAPVAYSMIDLTGGQVAGNQRYADLFGYSLEELDRIDVASITHPDDRERTAGYLADLAAGRLDRYETEKRYLRKDGSIFWGRLTITVLHDLDGAPEFLLGSIEDITERRAATEALARSRDEAVSLSEAKSEFVARVAHDLRTPLAAIRGLAELIVTGGDAAERSDTADLILRTSDSLMQMLDDLLDLSKMEAGRLELAPVVFSPRALLGDVGDLLTAQARAKDLTLVVEPDASLPPAVCGDPLRLRQVLVNLIGNAVKFTDRGRVRVTASARPAGGGWNLTFVVADTGVGIPAESVPEIFEPFVQAHPDRPGGTGLGLAICRQLVEMMGGVMAVESVDGEGTTFRFDVSVSAAAQIAPSEPEPQAARREILVVEDTPVNQLLVTQQLERLGYRPVIAGTGEEALELLARSRPGAVLMDWRLPGIDGLETTRRLRQLEESLRLPRVPVIAMTASALARDREWCLAAGMDDFLAKPVSLAGLGEVLARWVDRPADPEPPAGGADGTAGPPAGPEPPPELARLYREVGDPALAGTVVDAFAAALPERRIRIAEAGAAGDHETLAAVAHTLRSTSAQLGATDVAAASAALEDLARAGETGVEAAVDDLVRHIDRLEETLARWRRSAPGATGRKAER